MNKLFRFAVLLVFAFSMFFVDLACKKDSGSVTDPNNDGVTTYPVKAQVFNPQGQAQFGATLSVANAPSTAPKYTAVTDSIGWATIQAPAGAQTLLAKIGAVFQATVNVTVSTTSTLQNPQVVVAPIKLVQNVSSGKVLVVMASAEYLEGVLHKIGYNTFDSVQVYAMRDSAASDSARLLTFLKQYKLVFSDCDGGTEYSYPLLARVYGRYVEAGGKIYGGHYNYYNLENWLTGYYRVAAVGGNTATDTMQIVDLPLAGGIGALLDWRNSGDSRHLSGYEKFSDIPPTSKIYGVIYRTSPAIPVVIENYASASGNGGKYLWTNYHNQDIQLDPTLIKIVWYFLYNM